MLFHDGHLRGTIFVYILFASCLVMPAIGRAGLDIALDLLVWGARCGRFVIYDLWLFVPLFLSDPLDNLISTLNFRFHYDYGPRDRMTVLSKIAVE